MPLYTNQFYNQPINRAPLSWTSRTRSDSSGSCNEWESVFFRMSGATKRTAATVSHGSPRRKSREWENPSIKTMTICFFEGYDGVNRVSKYSAGKGCEKEFVRACPADTASARNDHAVPSAIFDLQKKKNRNVPAMCIFVTLFRLRGRGETSRAKGKRFESIAGGYIVQTAVRRSETGVLVQSRYRSGVQTTHTRRSVFNHIVVRQL